MFQTAYTGIQTLQRNYTYVGGFCKFYYIPVEDIAVFPRINAATQWLVDEPALLPDKAWYGPIIVPRDKLGLTETGKRTKAGIYYETKVEGIHIGESVESRVNLENLPYHKYLVIGKVRAGGFYMLVGSTDSPLRFDPEFKSGNGPGDTAQTQFSFYTEHISKAYVLPAFSADTIAPVNGSTDGPTTMNQKEIIPFNQQSLINIVWTPTRLGRFGNFPTVQIWLQEGNDLPFLSNGGSIEVDAPPPAFTELMVKPGGVSTGFIVLE